MEEIHCDSFFTKPSITDQKNIKEKLHLHHTKDFLYDKWLLLHMPGYLATFKMKAYQSTTILVKALFVVIL